MSQPFVKVNFGVVDVVQAPKIIYYYYYLFI